MNKMKFFILFALLLFTFIGYKTYEQYQKIGETQNLIVLNEGQSLSEIVLAFRQTYQDTFLRNHITIDEKTLNLLPVKTIAEISSRFSSAVEGNVVIRTVSDRPRNPENMANDFEMEMIEFFKKNVKEKERFIKKKEGYHYVKPLLIEDTCLKCHGQREDAIPSIRDRYDYAYGYKLGEIRGVLNIEIKKHDFFQPMYNDFGNTIISTVLIYIICLLVIYMLIRMMQTKEAQYRQKLETEIEEKTYEIKNQKKVFETLFEKASDGILILEKNKFIQCNEKVVEMLRYGSKEELLNTHPSELSPEFQPDGRGSYEKSEEMIALALKNEGHQFEWVHRKADGETFLAEVTLTPIRLGFRNLIHVVWRDISQKRRAEEKLLEQKDILHYQAHHDALTGLSNRILFKDRLEHGIEIAKRHGKKLALCFIDLDRFKQINDSLGHQIGDKVLKIVTERLLSSIRKEDTLSRLGGDEFTIIMEDLKTDQDVSFMVQKVQERLGKPLYIENHSLYVSCSIGISLYPKDGTDVGSLLKYADAAMYRAKEEGRNRFQFYSPEMTELAMERVTMEADMRLGLHREEFIVYYQPQIDGHSGRLKGMEALVRWQHPTMGLVFPAKFIALAEETGLIVELDQWVMQKAMRQVVAWRKEGLDPGVLALNLSMQDLRSKNFITTLQDIMETTGFKPAWLELEVTESEMMKKPMETMKTLETIGSMGIGIAIDDFGTGYSSLAYLKRLPVDKLKIDQSFIKGLPDDNEDISIAQAIIALAQSLGLESLAEGVETNAQRDFLLESGCHNIQGYYYSKPLPAEQMKEKFLG